MAKFTFHNSGESSYFTLETIPRPITGLYPTSSTQINFISGSGFSDVTSSVENPFVENDFKWSVVLPPGTSSFVWPSGSTENATTVPASESKMAATGEGTVTIGDTIFNLQDLTSFTFAPELTPGSGGGGGGLATVSNTFSMFFDVAAERFIVPDSNNLRFVDTDFSISFWLNPSTSGNQIIMDKYGPAAAGWGVYLQSGNLRFLGYGPNYWQTMTTISLNTWTHVTIVGDYTNQKLICYKNGIEAYNDSYALSINSNTTDLIIGTENTSTTLDYHGLLDEIAFFTSSLDVSTIESIYSASLPLGSNVTADLSTLSTPPVAWYRMGD